MVSFSTTIWLDSGLPLGDAKTPKFHIDDYIRLYKDPYIRQFRKKFRGAGKSIQSNVGNILSPQTE